MSSGFELTGRPDTVVERIDLWLDSEHSENLRQSLANETPGTERHAVLVFDVQTEPEYRSAVAQGVDFCPNIDVDLPVDVDVLWSTLGPIACRYTSAEGWSTTSTP